MTCLKARDEGGPSILGQYLNVPVTDTDFSTDSYVKYGDGTYGLSKAIMKAMVKDYASTKHDLVDPYLAPCKSKDLSNLPRALVHSNEWDILRDEGKRYAEKMAGDGVHVSWQLMQKMWHSVINKCGWYRYECDIVEKQIVKWMHKVLNGQ